MTVSRLAQLLDSSDSEIRRQAIARAATLADMESVDLLIRGLGDEDWRVRKEAVRAVATRPTERELVKRLVRALEPNDNVGLRNSAVEALGGHGALTVELLEEKLNELDADGRKLAAEALAQTQHAEALRLLKILSADPDVNVRAAALEAVAEVGKVAPEGASRLLDQSLEQPDPFLRLVTLDAIRRLGFAPSWARLRGLLSDPMLVPTGLELAARLGEPEAAPFFVQELERSRGGSRTRLLTDLACFIDRSEATCRAASSALTALSEPTHRQLLRLCEDNADTLQSCHALVVLGAAGNPDVARIALGWLADERLAAAARRSIELLGARAISALISGLDSEEELERATCLELLARIEVEEPTRTRVLDAIRPLGDDTSTAVVRSWMNAMIELEDAAGLERSLVWITDSAPAYLRSVAMIAGRKLAESHPEQARRIASGISPEDERASWTCVFIGAAPGRILESAAREADFLTAAVSNPQVSARICALEALATRSAREVVDTIAFALNDEEQQVQLAALRALGGLRDENGVAVGTPFMLELADSEQSLLVVSAVRALGQARDPRALPELAAWACGKIPWKAVAAIEALGEYTEKERAEPVRRALGHADSEVVKAALEVLATSGSAAEPEVIECLDHEAWDVRRLAADVLGARRTKTARKALSNRLSREQEPIVSDAIVRSLASFESNSNLLSVPPSSGREPDSR